CRLLVGYAQMGVLTGVCVPVTRVFAFIVKRFRVFRAPLQIGIVGYASGSSNFSVNWVILSYIICVIGELCLSPTGNSAAVKLAPKAFNAQMMSIWYLTNASAQAINGTLVKLIEPLGQTNYFIFLGVVAIIVTTIVLAFSPLIIKAMKGIR
ncbi:POT-type proton-dependent oligopeptide transporter, partial [Staphylococcus aureus]